ncbi:hypothetical protein [Microtetraspora malaysiensis]|uniref:hypothetical protein n=1 Tax=Microtetraspora malaysiensis TaxID=161358 RepID=UPI003D8D6C3F
MLQPLGRDGSGQPRYRFHDLIRLFAREQAEAAEPPDARLAVLSRAFGALLGLAEQAREARYSNRYPMVPCGNAPRWLPEDASQTALLSDPLAWLESERLNLVSAVTQSAELQLADLCRDLAASVLHALGEAQLGRGETVEAGSTLHQALRVARRVGDRLIEGWVLLALGHLKSDDSAFHLQQAAETFAAIGATGWQDEAVRAVARVSV